MMPSDARCSTSAGCARLIRSAAYTAASSTASALAPWTRPAYGVPWIEYPSVDLQDDEPEGDRGPHPRAARLHEEGHDEKRDGSERDDAPADDGMDHEPEFTDERCLTSLHERLVDDSAVLHIDDHSRNAEGDR